MEPTSTPVAPADFSLVAGGPCHRLLTQVRLARHPVELVGRRAVVITLFAWVPLLVLTVWERHAAQGVAIPFLFDLDAHVRLLGSIPLMIVAEVIVHARIKRIIEQFTRRDLVRDEDCARFHAALASTARLRDSSIAEVVIAIFSLTLGYVLWRGQVPPGVPTWFSTGSDSLELTTAGHWYAFVSLPMFRFILLRWYWRLALWYRLAWKLSRLDLRTNALHPDRAGGLGFLSASMFAFTPVLVAQTLLLSGVIANRIWHHGQTLPAFKLDIAGFVTFLVVTVMGPLAFFFLPLARAKRTGRRELGILASAYVNAFRSKWIERPPNANEPMLGTADIQSLADLANGYDVVGEMRPLPFGRKDLMSIAIFVALPLFPLALTMIPIEEMIDRLLGIFF